MLPPPGAWVTRFDVLLQKCSKTLCCCIIAIPNVTLNGETKTMSRVLYKIRLNEQCQPNSKRMDFVDIAADPEPASQDPRHAADQHAFEDHWPGPTWNSCV